MKENFKFIYFNDCPNAILAKNLISKLQITCDYICQDELAETHELKSYSSPTLLLGDKIIFGAKTDNNSSGCSIDIPTLEELKHRISSSQ